MFLTIWVHGTADDTETPCGEVDVFEISGKKIHCSILEVLMDRSTPSLKMDWFGHLPTERALCVEVKDVSDEDGINLQVVGYFEKPDAELKEELQRINHG